MIEDSENRAPASFKEKDVKNQKKELTEKTVNGPLRPSPPNEEKRIVKKLGRYQFSMDQRVGSGMSGDVYVGVDTQTLQLVCIKVIDREVYKTPEQKLLLQNQIRCQGDCNSEYTIRILDVFDTASFCFIITEFCEGGDLYRLLKSSPNGLPEPLVSSFGLQIAKGLKRLKEAKVVHRDIKSQNILLQKGQCKLGDFGFAVEQSKLEGHKFNLGSPIYMSLEALERSEYSYASDVFAFGVVLFEMIHKQSPWQCSQESELKQKMKTEEPIIKSGISQPMKTLILNCLNKDPSERPSIEEITKNQALKQLQMPPSDIPN